MFCKEKPFCKQLLGELAGTSSSLLNDGDEINWKIIDFFLISIFFYYNLRTDRRYVILFTSIWSLSLINRSRAVQDKPQSSWGQQGVCRYILLASVLLCYLTTRETWNHCVCLRLPLIHSMLHVYLFFCNLAWNNNGHKFQTSYSWFLIVLLSLQQSQQLLVLKKNKNR